MSRPADLLCRVQNSGVRSTSFCGAGTPTRPQNLNPQWSEAESWISWDAESPCGLRDQVEVLSDWPAEEGTHKFLVYSLTEQFLTVDLYDENPYIEEPCLESGKLTAAKLTARPSWALGHRVKLVSWLSCFNASPVA